MEERRAMSFGTPAGLTRMGGDRGAPAAVATLVWTVEPGAGRADIPVLCARLADLLRPYRQRGAVVVCDLTRVAAPSAATVELLARLRLTARRFGGDIRVRGAHPHLLRLLALTGLGEGIPSERVPSEDGGSAGEPYGQAEQREQPLDVQEVGDPADPVA